MSCLYFALLLEDKFSHLELFGYTVTKVHNFSPLLYISLGKQPGICDLFTDETLKLWQEKLSSIVGTAKAREWHKSFDYIERAVGVVGRVGLVT